MKKKLMRHSGTLMIVTAIGLLFYMGAGQVAASYNQSTAIQIYNEQINGLDPQVKAAEMKKAIAYNQLLSGQIGRSDEKLVTYRDYYSILNLDDMMGYLRIPSIDINLPIYHGTSESVLRKGVGHMPASSLPVGGESSHAVLSGHSGMPAAKMFNELEKVAVDDYFYIQIMDEELTYQVDRILVVEPHEVDEIRPVAGRDYVTLVTCTPYGINSHRLLVRGERVLDPLPEEEAAGSHVPKTFDDWRPVCIVVVLITAAVIAAVYRKKFFEHRCQ